jgi:membrane-associated protein
MKSGRPLYYLPDMDFGSKESIFVPFFGVQTATISGLSRLARLAGATVVPCVTRILPGGAGYAVEVGEPWANFPERRRRGRYPPHERLDRSRRTDHARAVLLGPSPLQDPAAGRAAPLLTCAGGDRPAPCKRQTPARAIVRPTRQRQVRQAAQPRSLASGRIAPYRPPPLPPMEYLTYFIDIVLHLDKHLAMLVQQYGQWIYVILFVIIFSETGFVVTPFLPGDSLLFVAGALAAVGGMDLGILMVVLMAAAILGNMLNYQIGRYLGPKVFHWEQSRFFNRAALDKTHAFYEKHGGKTLVISRFLPLFRTFAPFVAGIGAMSYARFTFFNLIGGVSWVGSLTLAGYLFGNLPWIQKNLTLVILVIIAISLLPLFIGWLQHRKAEAEPKAS